MIPKIEPIPTFFPSDPPFQSVPSSPPIQESDGDPGQTVNNRYSNQFRIRFKRYPEPSE